MFQGSTEPLADLLREGRILTAAQTEEFTRQLLPRFPEPRTLARELLARGWLTPFQVNQIFQGRGRELILGPYLILERLGEGGTGQVFKARHLHMQRIVAIKLIRADLLVDAEVVARFYREVQVLSQLSHPNVVHAFDAGPVGATHFLVMEYVEGVDLGQLVKKAGLLPVQRAIDYVTQAAVGLQHIHERGLIHRDIKPSNLLLTQAQGSSSVNVVKILDLGLARLRRHADGELTARMTPVGSATMGTPDYLAPEQALDFHEVDIRADIYGLGCTLFFLLAGKPPFPGGSMAQKLLKHQQAVPPSITQLRPEVPVFLEPVLQRMLAKRPEDRFATPALVAAALGGAESPTEPFVPVALPVNDDPTVRDIVPPVAIPLSAGPTRSRRQFRIVAGAFVLFLLVCGLVAGMVGWLSAPGGRATVSATSSPDLAVRTSPSNRPPTTAQTPTTAGAVAQDWASLRSLILPSPEENPWLKVAWLTSLWEARKQAAAKGKPIFLWNRASHPLGTACNTGLENRRTIFSDREILRRVSTEFVPVATDDWYLRRQKDPEGELLRALNAQGLKKGPDSGFQGMYCLAADGKFLAYANPGGSVQTVHDMMNIALKEWLSLPENSRAPGAMVVGDLPSVDAQYHRVPPPGGAIVNVWTRLLEPAGPGKYRRAPDSIPGGGQSAHDHLWLTAAECQALGLVSGQKPMEAAMARVLERVLRYHLIDNTRGEPTPWRPEEVRVRKVQVRVQRTPEAVSLLLEGAVLAATHPDPAQADRGFAARLGGLIRYDLRRKTLDRFEILVGGEHWGEGPYTKGARPGRQPLGMVFELSHETTPADLVPPYGIRNLGDYLGPEAAR